MFLKSPWKCNVQFESKMKFPTLSGFLIVKYGVIRLRRPKIVGKRYETLASFTDGCGRMDPVNIFT